MQDKSNTISLKQWFSDNKNVLETSVLEVLNSKAAQHPLFPCCCGLFIRGEIGLARNQMQPIDELLKDMEARGLIISHRELGLLRWRLSNQLTIKH